MSGAKKNTLSYDVRTTNSNDLDLEERRLFKKVIETKIRCPIWLLLLTLVVILC